jgi:hypothetical protein
MDKVINGFFNSIGAVPGAIWQAFVEFAADQAHHVLVVGASAAFVLVAGVGAAYGLQAWVNNKAKSTKLAAFHGTPAE